MAMFKPGKKYGLILNSKKQEQETRANPLKGSNMKKPSIFGADSSDSDNEGQAAGDWVAKSMKVKANNSGLKKQSKIQMSKALEEDPTVFQYDEVYDDIEKKKVEEKESKKDVDRKPKYVHNLLKAADERQKEFERRIERQVQKEREAEGDMYKDKESFVTSAYRKKMEEIAKQEEEEARKERLEAALDVTKQGNMDGFYRHLYRQTMGEEKEQVEAKKMEEETEEEKAARVKEEIKKIKIDDVKVEEEESKEGETTNIKKIDRNKGFRKKEVVESSSEDESSSGESGSEAEEDITGKDAPMSAEEKFEKRKQELREQRERREKRKRKIEEDASSSESEDESDNKKTKAEKPSETEEADIEEVEEVKPEESKPRINIWEKRTVGDLFEAAVRKYWERKAAREAGS